MPVPDATSDLDFEVLDAVAKLSIQQRSAIFLTYWEDMSPEKVAEQMGISTGSVKRHLARARKRLGEMLS